MDISIIYEQIAELLIQLIVQSKHRITRIEKQFILFHE